MLQRLIRQIFGKRGKAPETSPRLDALLAAGRRAHLEGRHADAERSYRAVWDPWDMFWASAVWFQPTPAAREFADWNARYLAACLRSGGLQWMLDQASLFCVRAHLAAIGRAPRFEMLPPGMALLAGSLTESAPQASPPAGTVFWSIIFSLTVNHSALDHPLFKRYLRPGPPGTGMDGAGRQA